MLLWQGGLQATIRSNSCLRGGVDGILGVRKLPLGGSGQRLPGPGSGSGAHIGLKLPKTTPPRPSHRELRNIYHHHPESKKRKSSEAKSGSIHPYGRYGNAVKTRKTISTIAILWPVKAIFEKRAATVEVDSFISPVSELHAQVFEHQLGCEAQVLEVQQSLVGYLQ